jgi:hypothetical protein
MKEDIINLAEALGYVLITPNKNPHMVSFYKEENFDFRVNVYLNGTLQVQRKDGTWRIEKNLTLSQLETILNEL